MHKTKEQLYQKIKDLKTKDEFEKEIKRVLKETDELFDEDTAALFVVDELGRNQENVLNISELEPNIECTVFGKVTNIQNSRSFNRKNGTSGKVVNLELSDETGSCGLALWDKDVELVKSKKIKVGTNVKVINGYVKDGFKGIEINVGRFGLLEIEPKHMPEIIEESEKTVKGKIVDIEPTRAFFKDDGEFGFVTNMTIQTSKQTKQITIWGEKVKEIQKLKQGDTIEIDNFDLRQNNGKEEIHLNSKGKIRKI